MLCEDVPSAARFLVDNLDPSKVKLRPTHRQGMRRRSPFPTSRPKAMPG